MDCDNVEIQEKQAVKPPKKNKLKEFILDPSSGQFSMSRLCLGVVVLIFLPIVLVMYAYHINVPATIIVSVVASLATVYAANSAFGAYGRGIMRSMGYSSRRMPDPTPYIKPTTTPTTKIPEERGEV